MAQLTDCAFNLLVQYVSKTESAIMQNMLFLS